MSGIEEGVTSLVCLLQCAGPLWAGKLLVVSGTGDYNQLESPSHMHPTPRISAKLSLAKLWTRGPQCCGIQTQCSSVECRSPKQQLNTSCTTPALSSQPNLKAKIICLRAKNLCLWSFTLFPAPCSSVVAPLSIRFKHLLTLVFKAPSGVKD